MGEKLTASRATANQRGGSQHSYGGSVEEFRLQDEEKQPSAFTQLLTTQQLSLAPFPVWLQTHTELRGLGRLLPVFHRGPVTSLAPPMPPPGGQPRLGAWNIAPPRLLCR